MKRANAARPGNSIKVSIASQAVNVRHVQRCAVAPRDVSRSLAQIILADARLRRVVGVGFRPARAVAHTHAGAHYHNRRYWKSFGMSRYDLRGIAMFRNDRMKNKQMAKTKNLGINYKPRVKRLRIRSTLKRGVARCGFAIVCIAYAAIVCKSHSPGRVLRHSPGPLRSGRGSRAPNPTLMRPEGCRGIGHTRLLRAARPSRYGSRPMSICAVPSMPAAPV